MSLSRPTDRSGVNGGAETVFLPAQGNWSPDVRKALNDLFILYGRDGNATAPRPYAIFDFDNTCSVFDIEEQVAVFQLQRMAFAIRPGQMYEVLLTGLEDVFADRTEYGFGPGTYSDWASDIADAYEELWSRFGPFSGRGVAAELSEAIYADEYWLEFASKIRAFYDLIHESQTTTASYLMMSYWFTGMTEDEIYDLAYAAISFYKNVPSSRVRWTSPAALRSRVGVVSVEWTSGVSVPQEINELWRALDLNGIDVWVCSASYTAVIRAAIDVFGLRDHCVGMLGLVNRADENGRYLNARDLTGGRGYLRDIRGGWSRLDRENGASPMGADKVKAISNVIAPMYGGAGPVAGFMDSTGDFNFCTEFRTMKLVVCFNRGDRSVRDGGGLVAETAVYEKEVLGYDLASANSAGDTLFVLQGRDENGMRGLRSSPKTLHLGAGSTETLFKNRENELQLDLFVSQKPSVAQIMNEWSVVRSPDENGLGFPTGFLAEYNGYHSHL